MTTRQITPPSALAVSLASAKASLRIEESDNTFDASITLWLKGITRECEHQLGRSLVHQQWRLSIDYISEAIRLPHAPIVSVESLQYYDVQNVLQTLEPLDYTVDLVSTPGYIVPAPGCAWPETFDKIHAVVVDYTAGYGPDDTSVPENVQLYILARLTEQWDPATREFKATSQSMYIERLLDACRTFSL